jgi:FtsP/CotA-like multicopper oxidase with cupredoxin domain/plastocyanin
MFWQCALLFTSSLRGVHKRFGLSPGKVCSCMLLVSIVWQSAALITAPGPATAGSFRGTAPVAQAAAAHQSNQVREFTLEAVEAQIDLAPGVTVRAWTYNGQLPGPELRVQEGDTVRILVKNSLPVPTTIHWHGIDVTNSMDGVPGVTQDPIQPGETFTYEFVAKPAGTRWYHSHQDPEMQVPLGLYGPLIVEPRDIAPAAGQPAPVRYDREYTVMLQEWALGLTPEVAMGVEGAVPPKTHSKEIDRDLFLMNGRASDGILPLQIKQGQRMRIRLINAGSLVHSIHLHGHQFKIVATDGNPVPPAAQLIKDTVTIGPAERFDLEIVGDNPGYWMFHCHMEHHMANGMMTLLQYEGYQPPLLSTTHVHAPQPAAPAASADPTTATQRISMTDNRFGPATSTVPAGTTVAWTNQGVNLHTITSLDGLFDSGAVKPGDSFAYTFTRPGTYRVICRQHLLNGMAGVIHVQ